MRISKAQSLSEYTIYLAVIILAIGAMEFYVRRGLQGRYADVVDHTTARIAQRSHHSQYEPYYVDEEFTVSQDKDAHLSILGMGSQVMSSSEAGTHEGTRIEGINCYDD